MPVKTGAQLRLLEPVEPQADFFVRESARARRMSIRVHPHGRVEVVVPRRTKPRAVEEFVRDHRGWIDRATREMSVESGSPDMRLPEILNLRGIDARVGVRYRSATGLGVSLREGHAGLELSGSVHDEQACRGLLKQWLAKSARRRLVPWLERSSRETGLNYARVQVRGQRTRWGSYSSTGTLSINYCLMFLEPELVEYLFVHELCHSRHMNHSARYWRLVERFLPGCRQLDRALSEAWKDVPGWVLLP